MVHAFIMVKAATGHGEALADRLEELDGVVEASVVAGDFDIILEAEAEEVYDIISGIATRVRGLDDIEDTKTYICLE